jgi:hypothetical protein
VRSAEELRARWLALIESVMKRTGMYAGTGREMQLLGGQMVRDLCFLDDRDADGGRELSWLLKRFGKLGVAGPFEALFGSPSCQAEVASVYAEVLARLGYLAIDRPVSGQRWQELTAGARHFEDHDASQADAERILGEPSLIVDRRILCYAPAAPAAGWLFVDCHAERPLYYDAGLGRYEAVRGVAPLVRSVRLPEQDFEAALILTPYGKTLRWGPGWWIDHPGTSLAPKEAAIAAQLRAINAADPSQSLRSPGS